MKFHLINTNEPATEGRDYQALCKTEVRNAAFVPLDFTPGEKIADADLLEIRDLCRKCIREPRPLARLCAIVDGESAKQLDRLECAS